MYVFTGQPVMPRWNNADAVLDSFSPEHDYKHTSSDLIEYAALTSGVQVIMYWDNPDAGDYMANCTVLILRDGRLYEIHGSCCSCMGYEGQWDPEECTLESLSWRIAKCTEDSGTLSDEHSTMLEVLCQIQVVE